MTNIHVMGSSQGAGEAIGPASCHVHVGKLDSELCSGPANIVLGYACGYNNWGSYSFSLFWHL